MERGQYREYRPAGFDVNDNTQGFMVDAGSLHDFLSHPEDRRDARGMRYRLTHILVLVGLAKLAGEDWRHLRLGHAQRVMAAVNNLVLGLLIRRGVSNVPWQRLRYAAQWDQPLKLITSAWFGLCTCPGW